MANEKAGVGDRMEAAVARPNAERVGLKGEFDMACWETGPDGKPRKVWVERAYNGVVREGLAMLGNIALGAQRVTTNGPYLVLHNASYNSTQAWSNLSNSQVSGYSAQWLPITISSTNATAGSWTATTAFTFTIAGTQTVSGAALCMYTATSAVTNPTAGDVKLYNIGTFSAAQNVQSSNTLSVTVTLSIGTV